MNRTQTVMAALDQAYIFPDSPAAGLALYHAAKTAINANRRVGTARRLAAIRKALKPFAVTVSADLADINGPIRLHNPRTQAEYIFGA